jgi:hypothetical protein
LKGCLVALSVLVGVPIALFILSAMATFLALYGHVILSVIAFLGAAGVVGLLVKSVIADFAETGGDFDTKGTVILIIKLLAFVGLAIALIIVLINAFR